LRSQTNPSTGWDSVLADAKPAKKASLVKVPHHGSSGAHHDRFWSELAEDDVIAIMTPWARGGLFLPTEDDLTRIRSLAKQAYLTSAPKLVRARKHGELQKLLHKLGADDRLRQLQGWGHVRARRRIGEHHWRIELDGDTTAIHN
jgi:hypothetical protein